MVLVDATGERTKETVRIWQNLRLCLLTMCRVSRVVEEEKDKLPLPLVCHRHLRPHPPTLWSPPKTSHLPAGSAKNATDEVAWYALVLHVADAVSSSLDQAQQLALSLGQTDKVICKQHVEASRGAVVRVGEDPLC